MTDHSPVEDNSGRIVESHHPSKDAFIVSSLFHIPKRIKVSASEKSITESL